MQHLACRPILSPVQNAPSSLRLPTHHSPEDASTSGYTPLRNLRNHDVPEWSSLPLLQQRYLANALERHVSLILHYRLRMRRTLLRIQDGNRILTYENETME